jgi:cathepsin H
MEAHHFLKYGQMKNLSEQQVSDAPASSNHTPHTPHLSSLISHLPPPTLPPLISHLPPPTSHLPPLISHLSSPLLLLSSLLFVVCIYQLVDCAGAFNNFGCDGGLPSQAFEYLMYSGGQDNETTYQYTAKDGKCYFKPADAVARVAKVNNITSYDEDELLQAVGTAGPVSIAYEVADDFRHYKSGVYDGKCKTDPQSVNHAVVAIGYGERRGLIKRMPYWIVRNCASAGSTHDASGPRLALPTLVPLAHIPAANHPAVASDRTPRRITAWGTSWGMDGYFEIKRGVNKCGLSDCASFPTPA